MTIQDERRCPDSSLNQPELSCQKAVTVPCQLDMAKTFPAPNLHI